MMVVKIVGGIAFGSLALLATAGTCGRTRRPWSSRRSQTGALARTPTTHASRWHRKLGEFAAFASAVILAMIALLIGYESVVRLVQPVEISFSEAIPIAVVGLAVDLLSFGSCTTGTMRTSPSPKRRAP